MMIDYVKDKFTCCVLGLGYIGLPTAALIAKSKNKVIGVDINKKVVDLVNNGKIHIVEDGLENLVCEVVNNGNLIANTKPTKADVFVISVPTPLEKNSNDIPKPNIDFVIKAVGSIINFLEPGNLVILESTSPVGTTEKIADIIYKETALPKFSISIAYCPERVLPGNAINEIISNSRVVGGIDSTSAKKGKNFYQSFCNSEIIKTNAKTAEFVKFVKNSYIDVNIAFSNEISMISRELGVIDREVIEIANKHPRVRILQPGCGVGGHCIAIDPWFIAFQSPDKSKLIQAARNVNLNKTLWSLEIINERINKFENDFGRKPILGIFGLTFKANIDDTRESPALFITKKLIEQQKNVIVCEPNIKKFKNIRLFPTSEIIQKADILIMLVAHSNFKNLDFQNKEIIDLCGIS